MKKRQKLMRALAKTYHAWNNHVRDVTLAEEISDSYKTVRKQTSPINAIPNCI